MKVIKHLSVKSVFKNPFYLFHPCESILLRFYNPKEGLTRRRRGRRVKNILRVKRLTPWSFFSASPRLCVNYWADLFLGYRSEEKWPDAAHYVKSKLRAISIIRANCSAKTWAPAWQVFIMAGVFPFHDNCHDSNCGSHLCRRLPSQCCA